MKTHILFLLVLFSLTAFAQEKSAVLPLPDSLVGRLKENRKTDEKRAEALNAAIKFYAFEKHRIWESETYINELVEISNELKDDYWKALSLYYKSLCAYESYNSSEFLLLVNESMQITETLRKTKRTQFMLARIYLIKGAYFSRIHQFPDCQRYIEKGLKIAENNGFDNLKYCFHNNYGTLLMQMDDYENAINEFKPLLGDSTRFEALINIALLFQQLQQYDSAFYYLDSVFRNLQKADEDDFLIKTHLIRTYQNKAVCHLDLGQWDDAMQCLNESSALLGNYDPKDLLCVNYLHLADVYDGMGLDEIALDLVDTAILIAKEAKLIEWELNSVKQKSNILENLKDYEKEVENMRYFNALTDTINKREDLLKVKEQQYQREAQIMEQQYELERQTLQQKQLVIIIFAVVMVIITALVIVLIMLNRKRLAAELELRNREITAKSMDKIQSNEMLNDVIKKLTEMEEHPEKNELPSIIRDLKTLVDVDTKKDFDLYFVQVHPDFYEKLLADFPKLTNNELRLCAFIKSNLSIKEIAAINGISAESVKTARKRLRKSLNLTGEETTLLGFLSRY